ncbi:MAG TPA: pyridoxal phosphate-dependent aminotransferase [Candidatus Deferrimicrobiaceae bacterium]|nr:pyridoxal phosphate-dependent aminotransferase [Candidatus Deferrimicrobiaceae bacterium]
MKEGRLAPSDRAARVQPPIIPIVAGWISETPGTISLGQGVVHYGPPPAALAAIPAFLRTIPHHTYTPDAGLPELRKAFEEKLRAENGIDAPFERRIFVTVGANQAFLNAVLAICDPGDEVILLSPYYFNHEMAVTLASAVPVPVPVDERLQPDLAAIASAITGRTRAIVTVSPNNPTGAVYPRETLAAIHRLCAERGIYHVSDEAYEYFTYDGARHFSPGSLGGEHVISLYSLSKAYGMASWRVGFLVAPEHLHRDLMKIQDTVVVTGSAISQFVGLRAMRVGRAHCESHLPSLARVRSKVLERLAAIPDLVEIPSATGAFYLFARVNTERSALSLSERLVREHKVAVIPGETFGVTRGCWLRVAYGSLREETAVLGIDRLVTGLRAILGR